MQFSIKALSHHTLGQYLTENYLPYAPKRYVLAFLLGCTEPDKNPTTYLKGSLANRWLRGHNWESSQNYITRISARLERRKKLRLLDYYTMGKLIHYITDAFTFPHNGRFSQNLLAHRNYEADLQTYFLTYLRAPAALCPAPQTAIMDTVHQLHRTYATEPAAVQTDALFAVSACSSVVQQLLSGRAAYRHISAL